MPLGCHGTRIARMPLGCDGTRIARMPLGCDGTRIARMPLGCHGTRIARMPLGCHGTRITQMPLGCHGTRIARMPLGCDGTRITRMPLGCHGTRIARVLSGVTGRGLGGFQIHGARVTPISAGSTDADGLALSGSHKDQPKSASRYRVCISAAIDVPIERWRSAMIRVSLGGHGDPRDRRPVRRVEIRNDPRPVRRAWRSARSASR